MTKHPNIGIIFLIDQSTNNEKVNKQQGKNRNKCVKFVKCVRINWFVEMSKNLLCQRTCINYVENIAVS